MLKDKILMTSCFFYFWPQNCYLQGNGKHLCAAFGKLFLVLTEIPMASVPQFVWRACMEQPISFSAVNSFQTSNDSEFVDIEDSSGATW